MTGPKENVKIFGLRPVEAIAGLVPGGRHCIPIMAALPGLGIETDIVGVLHGADGLRILDPDPHGIGQRVLKFFQSWGYHAEIIKLYDEGLRKGESLIVVPTSYPDRVDVSRLMAGNANRCATTLRFSCRCRPTITFSTAVMRRNSCVFWNVRESP